MTLVCNLKESTVEYIGERRKEKSLTPYFEALGAEHCTGIEAINLDMWPAFINSCLTNVPDAEQKMVFDRFHTMQHVGKAVDWARKDGHKALMSRGDVPWHAASTCGCIALKICQRQQQNGSMRSGGTT